MEHLARYLARVLTYGAATDKIERKTPFFRTSDRWVFHFRSKEMLSPRTFTASTISNGLLLMNHLTEICSHLISVREGKCPL